MEEEVIEVIAEGVLAPEVVFEPESRVSEGIILGFGFEGFEPDFFQAGGGAELDVLLDVAVVVPDEAVFEDGIIGGENQGN